MDRASGKTSIRGGTSSTTRGIVFLDRDGTLNLDDGYVFRPERLVLIPGVAHAVLRLKREGFRVVVVSNQSAIGRRMASEDDVHATNRRLRELLTTEAPGAELDLVLFAPDHPDAATKRRKPGTGMVEEVAERIPFQTRDAWFVGDKQSDVCCGVNAGIPRDHCLLVLTGQGKTEFKALPEQEKRRQRVFADLPAAVDAILAESSLQTE